MHKPNRTNFPPKKSADEYERELAALRARVERLHERELASLRARVEELEQEREVLAELQRKTLLTLGDLAALSPKGEA